MKRYNTHVPTETLKRLYINEGQSLRQVARAVDMDPSSVRERLLKHGVTMRGRGQYERPETATRRARELEWMEDAV